MLPRQFSIIIFPFWYPEIRSAWSQLVSSLGPELYSSIMFGPSQFLLVQKDYSTEWRILAIYVLKHRTEYTFQ